MHLATRWIVQVIGQKFADVAHLRAELMPFCDIGRIILEQVPIILQDSATATGIVDDRIVLLLHEGIDVAASQVAGKCIFAYVQGSSAAAGLPAQNVDFVSFSLQNQDGSLVEVR